MADEITLEQIRGMAEAVGLARLTDEHLQQLLRATKTARQRRAALASCSFGLADEPAHVFYVERHA